SGRPDSDGDTVPDALDVCPHSPGCAGPGFCAPFNRSCLGCPASEHADSDGDYVPDCVDSCPLVDDNRDLDGDRVPDCRDNCTLVPNPSQRDSRGDGIGDACRDSLLPSVYTLASTLRKESPAPGDEFGNAVAASINFAGGETILVGAPFDDTAATDAGAGYLFDGLTGQC